MIILIIDGKKIKQQILDELKEKVSKLEDKPNFVVIQVGNNEASNIYIKQKQKMAEYIGYGFKHIKLEETITNEKLVDIINNLNNDTSIDGIMVQMPLPSHLNLKLIQNTIIPSKDIDGLTEINNGKLMLDSNGIFSCTPSGIMHLLKEYNIDPSGLNATIVGRSNLVGKPMSMMLLNKGATVTICHSKTKNLSEYTKNADILVVAVGHPKLITKDMVKENSVVIDVGINRLDTGLCGDVDYENIKDKVSYITPVPGGVGPMTVAYLAKNIYKAYTINKVR